MHNIRAKISDWTVYTKNIITHHVSQALRLVHYVANNFSYCFFLCHLLYMANEKRIIIPEIFGVFQSTN